MEDKKTACSYKCGKLPSCAPLALAYVPMQQSAAPKYEPDEALCKGTLFPGLDLPFMNMVNNANVANTPLGELMALDFVLDELELYLDTHENDQEAFDIYQKFLKLACEGRQRYVELYGPIQQSDMLGVKEYNWLKSPWPWEYNEKRGRR